MIHLIRCGYSSTKVNAFVTHLIRSSVIGMNKLAMERHQKGAVHSVYSLPWYGVRQSPYVRVCRFAAQVTARYITLYVRGSVIYTRRSRDGDVIMQTREDDISQPCMMFRQRNKASFNCLRLRIVIAMWRDSAMSCALRFRDEKMCRTHLFVF